MRLGKKVLDASAVIAFLYDMSCPECVVELSRHCELFVPEEVKSEVRKQPGKQRLQDLIRDNVIKVVKADTARTAKLINYEFALGDGECAAIAAVLTQDALKGALVVSDDAKARKAFGRAIRFVWTEELLDIMLDRGIIGADAHASSARRLRGSRFYSRDRRA